MCLGGWGGIRGPLGNSKNIKSRPHLVAALGQPELKTRERTNLDMMKLCVKVI